ncbi:transporter substrate-binding domain-containing protein [Telmatospirillum sp.]|uniref:substrate-binding periplasmic protein n=1 Tax=Telmatospirillum sp. TaxID=2079197 RepID=UPI00285129D1|nr:transporter substrate-binding domain-containing protein [Telmatospirillum sp.]MDR3440547.1 ABC transporter substrate-binding protein [Telmatospirillum sp.]
MAWPPQLLLIAAFAGFASFVNAAEPPDCSRPFTLALHDHGLLYSSETDKGIDKDVSDELIARSGCKVTVSLMPRARIWQLIESGALDFSLSGITNSERDVFASFAWYFSNKYYLLVRNDTGVHQLADFERAPHLRLGVIRSFRFGPGANAFVDGLLERQRVVYAGGLPPLYEMLMADRIQGMIIEPFDYPALQEQSIRAATRIVEFNDPSVLHGLIMSRKSLPANELEKWRNIIVSMRRYGALLNIFRKYFPDDIADTMVNY